MPFLDSLDVANRALQHCGVERILDVDEESKNNRETAFAYDTLREPELRRNTWRFAIKKAVLRPLDVGTQLLDPRAWDATITYLFGSLVVDDNGTIWQSMVTSNVANDPATTTAWEEYFGPLAVGPHDATLAYSAGEVVYVPTGNPGSFVVFLSLQNDNDDAPTTTTPFDATVTYSKDAMVSYGGDQWRSLIPLNLGITPAVAPGTFDPAATYALNDTVTGADGYIYTSLSGGNIGHTPTTSPIYWTNTTVAAAWAKLPAFFASSMKWLPLYATLKPLTLLYPIGTGPFTQQGTRNVFRLPSGWLKKAPRDPKAGSNSYLGAPSGLDYDDWLFEGDYIISNDPVIVHRFVANVQDVRRMDAMFCEGLACRIAMGVCESLTQSVSKLGAIATQYKQFMTDARTVNGIETGSEEPPEDDYITCRY